VDGGVVEDEYMVIVWVMLLKDVHSGIDLAQDILIGEVPLPVRTRPK